MKMVVGLGNPGRRYVGTRHNVGFQVLAKLAADYGAATPRQRFQAEVAEVRIGQEKVILLSPLTFMNVSGSSVQPACDFYQLETSDLLVVSDDLNLPLAQLRFRGKGSAGGQKGLADVLRRLGTQDVPRLRIGIGPVPPRWDAADFVLGKFTREELPEIDAAIGRAAQAVVDWIENDIQFCMNQYNATAKKNQNDEQNQDGPNKDGRRGDNEPDNKQHKQHDDDGR